MGESLLSEVVAFVAQVGFPAAIAIWALRELRQQTKDSNKAYAVLSEQFIESLKSQRIDYAETLEKVCKNYDGLSEKTTLAIEKNTTTLNGLTMAINRMNGDK